MVEDLAYEQLDCMISCFVYIFICLPFIKDNGNVKLMKQTNKTKVR